MKSHSLFGINYLIGGGHIPYIKYALLYSYLSDVHHILMQTLKTTHLPWLLVVKINVDSLNRIDQAIVNFIEVVYN